MNKTVLNLLQACVVVTILVMFAGACSLALNGQREAARRSQCSNNLRQIAIGLQNYHDTFLAMPYGVRARGKDGEAGGFGPSWHVSILPFCEMMNLYNLIDKVEHDTTSGYETATVQSQAANANIVYLLCPSSPLPQTEMTASGSGPLVVPSYVGISGAVAGLSQGEQTVTNNGQTFKESRNTAGGAGGLAGSGGMLLPNQVMGMAAAIDGTSLTIVVGETSDFFWNGSAKQRIDGSSVCGWPCGTDTYGKVGDGPDVFASHNVFNLTTLAYNVGVNGKPPAAAPAPPAAAVWDKGGVGQGTATSGHGANNPLVSSHPAGAQVAFLDGHVAMLPKTTDHVILLRLATRDDGGSVGDF